MALTVTVIETFRNGREITKVVSTLEQLWDALYALPDSGVSSAHIEFKKTNDDPNNPLIETVIGATVDD